MTARDARGNVAAARLTEAAATVVARDGFDVLSVRTVAREAGVAAGTVQYHFPTRVLLLRAAFEHTATTIMERLLAAGPAPGTPLRAGLRRLLEEALPLDERRHRDCVVWVALSAAAVSHPELARTHRRAVDRLRVALAEVITAARVRGEVHESVQSDPAARLLTAVVDGLTLQGLTAPAGAAVLVPVLDAAIRCALAPSAGS